jgi:hypothetical protein
MKYAYLIRAHTDLGEGYERQSKWHNNLNTCKKNLINTLNSKKLVYELNESEPIGCYIDVHLICNELDKTGASYYITEYEIIYSKYNITFSDGFEEKLVLEDF